MNEADRQRARLWLRIRGLVQGVGFRFSAVEEARSLGLTGWVRNTADGNVELVAEGAGDRLQRLSTWAHEGPRGAFVTAVEERWLPYAGEFGEFRIRH